MDERRLDQYFKDELESFPQPELKAGAWERMRMRLPESRSRQGLLTWLGLASLLLVASLATNFFLWSRFQKQQSQLNTLSENIYSFQQQFASQTDTLYVYRTDSICIHNTPAYYPKPQQLTSSNIRSPFFNDFPQNETPIDTTPTNRSLISESITLNSNDRGEAIISNTTTEPNVNSILTKLQETKDTTSIQASTPKLDTALAHSKKAPKVKKNQMLKDIKKYVTSRTFTWYLLSEIGTFSTPIADRGNAWSFGLGVQGNISKRFSLYSDFRFTRSFYKIERKLSDVTDEQLSLYPGRLPSEPSVRLTEIYANANGLNLGLGLGYDLLKSDKVRLTVIPSIQFQSDLSQQFEYEYLREPGIEELVEGSANGTPWHTRSLRFAVQADVLAGRFRPQFGLFYQTDTSPRGIEALRFNQFGFSTTWWWFSKKYFR